MEKTTAVRKTPFRRKRLGEFLVEFGLIDEKTLAKALDIQKIQKKRLGQILMDLGVADEEMIAKALADQLKIPFVRLDEPTIPKDVIALVPPSMAEHYLVMPIKRTEAGFLVAMANPLQVEALDDLKFVAGLNVEVAVAPEQDILMAIERNYGAGNLKKNAQRHSDIEVDVEFVQKTETDEEEIPDLMRLTELPPVVRLVNAILADAIKVNASDIHVEPERDEVFVRQRVDGVLRKVMKTDKKIHASLVSRIKVISNMDIAIRRKPQDGRSQVKFEGKSYDLRISTIPTSNGEKVVIRILDQSRGRVGLEDIGFSENAFEQFSKVISRPQGIILVTGPTGSGKSTTLYACLNKLNTSTVNITTVEDPIEYNIPGINQVQINPKAGITFGAGLRSILRQDPDIVMVGEIRDSETASTAFRAGQTGHLVFSTLHTNDAPSAVVRLMDLGVEAFNVSAALLAVVGQRLVRTICPQCKAPYSASASIMRELRPFTGDRGIPRLWRGTGCKACNYTGYAGRVAIFEHLTVTPAMREAITPGVSAMTLRRAADGQGFESMTVDGIRKALIGLTTIEEIFRVAPPEAQSNESRSPLGRLTMESSGTRETSDTKPAAAESRSRSKKILVADDNEIMLKVISKILASEDYIPITASNGVEAMKLALEEMPDLVITDFLMPEMDGKALVKKLKSQMTMKDIPVIMISAKDESDVDMADNTGAIDGYLKKPVNAKVLLAKINKLLNPPLVGNGKKAPEGPQLPDPRE